MAVATDLLRAKRALSTRFLRAERDASVPRGGFTLTVSAAVTAAQSGVHAVGVGRKLVEGVETDARAVRVYVAQKLPLYLVPAHARVPARIDGIPTDVVEAPPAFLSQMAAPATSTAMRRSHIRPLVGGISAGHQDVTVGTIACFCRSLNPGDPDGVYVLSNNHVFANVNRGRKGDTLLQPGVADSVSPDGDPAANDIARLHRARKIRLGGAAANRVDAAIGRLLPGVEYDPRIMMIGRVSGTTAAEEEMPVRKHGRTTGYTEGVVDDVSYDAMVGMDHGDPSVVARFENQLRIVRQHPFPEFALGGDSGSLVVHRERQEAVGLYFAGPDSGSYGIASPIRDVLAALKIEIL